MKKDITSKKPAQNRAKKAIQPARKSVVQTKDARPCFNPWSLSIYVYWFIILFFIAATFYILGRSHSVVPSAMSNVEVTEEVLLQSNDYYESGKTKFLSGDVEGAIADLTTAIDAGTEIADAYVLRGEAYVHSGNYAAAEADLNTAINMDAQNAIAYYDRALLHSRMENYQAALNDINNALAAQSEKPNDILQMRDLYAKRGQLNLWMKNWQGAVADYTNSLSRPDGIVNPTVYAERAEAYTALGQYQSAINDYTSAVRVISEQIQGATTAEEREAQSSNAMSYFEKSAALNLQLGNIDAARSDLESAYTIANAMGDAVTADRLQNLIAEIVM